MMLSMVLQIGMVRELLCALILSVVSACGDNDNASKKNVEPPEAPASVADCKKCIVLSEQSDSRVAIADVASQTIIWEWKPAGSVKPAHVQWFSNMSDAKPVYNNKYILANASGGGVALIRIADRKTMFYAYAGGNTHSAEMLPDGNIVSSSSTGNFMTVFKVDTINFPDNVYSKKVPIEFGHNVVWDHTNQKLWTAALAKMKVFTYNFNCNAPDLTLVESTDLPGEEAHDLFPVYGESSFWLTNKTHVYKFDPKTKTLKQADGIQPNIKSVSLGPDGFPTIIIHPKEQWWTDEVIDTKGKTVFHQKRLKIYKARWLVENKFSYPDNYLFKKCQ
jgi:hypothetical protein